MNLLSTGTIKLNSIQWNKVNFDLRPRATTCMNVAKVAGYVYDIKRVCNYVPSRLNFRIRFYPRFSTVSRVKKTLHEASKLIVYLSRRSDFTGLPFYADARPFALRLPLAIVLRLAPGWRTGTPNRSAGSGWNECRGSAGRVEKRVRSINQPPPWWKRTFPISRLAVVSTLRRRRWLRARAAFPRAHDASDTCVCVHVCWWRIRDVSAHAMTQLRLPSYGLRGLTTSYVTS